MPSARTPDPTHPTDRVTDRLTDRPTARCAASEGPKRRRSGAAAEGPRDTRRSGVARAALSRRSGDARRHVQLQSSTSQVSVTRSEPQGH